MRLLKGNVVRENREAGDVIILLGGKTGRDGVGGATGSLRFKQLSLWKLLELKFKKGMLSKNARFNAFSVNGNVTRLIKKS